VTGSATFLAQPRGLAASRGERQPVGSPPNQPRWASAPVAFGPVGFGPGGVRPAVIRPGPAPVGFGPR